MSKLYRIAAWILIPAMILPLFTFGYAYPVYAEGKTMTLNTARSLAIQKSGAYESAQNAVESKKAARESALKSLKAKQKNLASFRWTPLLNFKFPQKPDFSQASEFQFKPLQLASDVDVAEHKLQDTVFDINLKVNNLYVDLVMTQDKINFHEHQLESLQEGVAHNQARLKMGEANQSDVDRLQKKVDSLNNTLAGEKRTLAADLKKLSDMIGFDVTTGYTFEKPYVEAVIDRSSLPALITYTEDRDQSYYEACAQATTARLQLSTNYGLIKEKYGGDTNIISGYVNQALNGQEVSTKGFKQDYKKFLDKIDSYWGGSIPIIWVWWVPLVWIKREWLKGELDGIRYIQDDPYVLFQNVLDYMGAVKDQKAAQKELDQSVEDTFNQYISVRAAYEQAQKDVKKMENDLKEYAVKNRMGLMTMEEYQDQQDDYEELQNGMLDAMKLYTTTLYSFDRLTCGGISALLAGTDADMNSAQIGESYIEGNKADGAFYTLESLADGTLFELTLHIPDDFPVTITDYELWINNIQVGEKTPSDKKLRHLTLDYDTVSEAMIRVFNGDEFIDDVMIDPTVESGPLPINTGYEIKRDLPGQVGTFKIEQNETTGLMSLTFELNSELPEVTSFKVLNDEGKALGKDEPIEIDKPLVYVELLRKSLDDLTVEFYDEAGDLVETARFDQANSAVIREDEE